MHRRHEAHPNPTANSLSNPPLVPAAQPRSIRVHNPSHRRHILGEHREILYPIISLPHRNITAPPEPSPGVWKEENTHAILHQRIQLQHIKNIHRRLPPLLPLLHLHLAQIMRRVHIPRLPAPRNLLRHTRRRLVAGQILSRVRGRQVGRALRAVSLLALRRAVDQREQVLGGALVAGGKGAGAEVCAGGGGLAGACWGGRG